MSTLPVAVQLYSVREDMEADYKATLKKIKDMGYNGVELAGLYGQKASDLRQAITELDLVPVSAHVPYAELLNNLDTVIADYKEIGVSYIAIPSLSETDRPGGENFDNTMEEIRKIGAKLNENGITLLYHNHDFEFCKMPNGEYGLDYLYSNVSADLLKTEIDTCWVNVAKENPSEYVLSYKGRAPVVHLKDFVLEGEAANMYELIGAEDEKQEQKGKFMFMPVGSGCQDFPSILKASIEAGAKWVVVEQDRSEDIPAIEAVEKSIKYLNSFAW